MSVTHRTANMFVRDILRQKICNASPSFSKNVDNIFKILLNNTKMSSWKNYFFTQINKEMYFEQFPPFIIIASMLVFKYDFFNVSVSIQSH